MDLPLCVGLLVFRGLVDEPSFLLGGENAVLHQVVGSVRHTAHKLVVIDKIGRITG